MTRARIWSVVGVLAVLTLGLRWFVETFEAVPVTTPMDLRGEARRDPYLALTRFFERMQRPLRRTSDPLTLSTMHGPGVLVLDRRRAYHLSAEREQAVRRWVQAGGYLILVPEQIGAPDPLLDSLDLTWANPWDDEDDEDDDDDDDDDDVSDLPELPEFVDVHLPGVARPLRLDGAPGLSGGDVTPEWRAGHGVWGDQVLHFVVGAGAITVIVGFDDLTANAAIGRRDHAEFVWRLVERYGPTGPIVLLSRLHVPSIWEWMGTSARPALAAGGVALLLWIWRVAPRFGGVVALAPPDRRQLREHLVAVGRFVWRQHGVLAWIGPLRGLAAEKAARRLTALAGAAPSAGDVAHHTGLSPALVARALEDPVTTDADFVQAVRALQTLDRSL